MLLAFQTILRNNLVIYLEGKIYLHLGSLRPIMTSAAAQGEEASPIVVPQFITTEWVIELQARLDQLTRNPSNLKWVLTKQVVRAILERAEGLLKNDSTLVELELTDPAATVSVVGDTHGQYHDVCGLFSAAGYPSESSYFVFNGDFVDRGAWGLETLVLLLCWKLALPHRVFLLRGNHESATCTMVYGFKEELKAKYGKAVWQDVYNPCKRVFCVLPLAALVQRNTLVLHGGLFRSQPRSAKVPKNKRKRGNPVLLGGAPIVGTLDDLRGASRGGMDPSGLGSSRLASDVLWSDPTSTPGFEFNISRGIGMTFGPDVTERFLRDNNLRLVLRSHEGPDAREGRDDMGPMTAGYTLDHDTPCGKLYTVFSAPDYPQFVAEESERCHNRAAVAVLSAPDYATPRMVQFDAALPRPEAQCYYQLEIPGSDEEFEPASSDLSGMSSVTVSVAASEGSVGQAGGCSSVDLRSDGGAEAEAAGEVTQQQQQRGGAEEGEQQEPAPKRARAARMATADGAAAEVAHAEVNAAKDSSMQAEQCTAQRGAEEQGALHQPEPGAEPQGDPQSKLSTVLELFQGVLPGDPSSDGSKENAQGNELPEETEGLQVQTSKAVHAHELLV